MTSAAPDLARVRLDNAMLLFEEFVQATIKHPDAATLRGLEGRFAERLQIQPSYWSQIKARSRQIGERLARQFEQLCHKPAGWMDLPHSPAVPGVSAAQGRAPAGKVAPAGGQDAADHGAAYLPRDDDERFILGLVLTYYRRHPQRARTRLLDLLGEVLVPASGTAPSGGTTPRRPAPPAEPRTAQDDHALWAASQTAVAPLKKKR